MPEISPSKYLVSCGWSDVPHLDEKTKRELLEATPPHLRDARSKGIPALGSGAIYPVPESEVVCEQFQIPRHWKRAYALDVGWNKTACLWGAKNPDTNIIYLYSEYYRGQAEPSIHAQAIRSRGDWIKGCIDPAAKGRGQKDGSVLFDMYRDLGLSLVPANNTVETGIYEVWQRLSGGGLMIFDNLKNTLAEYRLYRRDENGKIVKEFDHLMDCFSGDTLIPTMRGQYRIEDLVGTCGYVLHPDGRWTKYDNCGLRRKDADVVRLTFSDGSQVKCTPDHLFLTEAGWVKAIDCIGYNLVSLAPEAMQSCYQLQLSQRPDKTLMKKNTIYAASIFSAADKDCTEMCGRHQEKRLYQKGGTYTILTTIDQIIRSTIYSLFMLAITFLATIRDTLDSQLRRLSRHQSNGIEATRGDAGTLSTVDNQHSQKTKYSETVTSAASNTQPLATAETGSAIRIVRLEHCEKEDVYCLNVEDGHAFALPNGVVTHNCMRYLIMNFDIIAQTEPREAFSDRYDDTRDSKTGY